MRYTTRARNLVIKQYGSSTGLVRPSKNKGLALLMFRVVEKGPGTQTGVKTSKRRRNVLVLIRLLGDHATDKRRAKLLHAVQQSNSSSIGNTTTNETATRHFYSSRVFPPPAFPVSPLLDAIVVLTILSLSLVMSGPQR